MNLSFALPVTLEEGGQMQWRAVDDSLAVTRLRCLLLSFLRRFRMADLGQFLLIAPAAQIPLLREAVASVTDDTRFTFAAEADICPDIISPPGGVPRPPGWYIQQALKIAAAGHVSTPFYVTLDADILCARPFGAASLIQEGRALANIENVADYARIYRPGFAQAEARGKFTRQQNSAALLGYARPEKFRGYFFGETPVALHRESVLALQSHLSARHAAPWAAVLAQHRNWTEYNLYFQFLEMTGGISRFHRPVHCNIVLDLEGSIWQPSAHYRTPRSYDPQAMAAGRPQGGLFIAIQSYLKATDWIGSTRHMTVPLFYRSLEAAIRSS